MRLKSLSIIVLLFVAMPALGNNRYSYKPQKQPVVQQRQQLNPWRGQRSYLNQARNPNQYHRHHRNKNFIYVPYGVPIITTPTYYNYPYYNYPQDAFIYRTYPEESIYFNKNQNQTTYTTYTNTYNPYNNSNIDYHNASNDPVPGAHEWQQVSAGVLPMGAIPYQNINGVLSYYCRAAYRGTLVYGFTTTNGCLANDPANAVSLIFQNYQVPIRIQSTQIITY